MRPYDEPPTETVKASDARSHWSSVLDRVRRGEVRIVVERSGAPVAVLISPADLSRLLRVEAEWDAPFQALDETRSAFADVPPGELDNEVAAAVREAREQLRAEAVRGDGLC